jgi:hypothetical protein
VKINLKRKTINEISYKISKKTLYFIIFLPVFFIISLILLNNYIYGDQEYYIALYEQFKIIDYNNVRSVAFNTVSSKETISPYLLWIGAQIGLSKNIFISILNTIFLIGIFLMLKKYNCPWYIYFLVLFNFYFIVLITAAERLKIAYIFMTYAAVFRGKIGAFFLILSPFAHFQAIFFVISGIFFKIYEYFEKHKQNFFLSKKFYKLALGLSLIILFIFFSLKEPILYKAQKYFTEDSISEIILYKFNRIIPLILLMITSLLISKKPLKIFLFLSLMVIPTILLDVERINMISYTIFFYIMLIENKLGHKFNVLILIYLAIKSIPFMKNIFINGNGFRGFLF